MKGLWVVSFEFFFFFKLENCGPMTLQTVSKKKFGQRDVHLSQHTTCRPRVQPVCCCLLPPPNTCHLISG